MLRKFGLLLLFPVAFAGLISAQGMRHFTFRNGFTIKNIPPGERVRIWIPAPGSNDFQEVNVVSTS